MKTRLEYLHSAEFRAVAEGAGYEVVEDVLMPEGKSLCDTTMTLRNPRTNCGCATYADNLGPCDLFEAGMSGRCVYCDHADSCHPRSA